MRVWVERTGGKQTLLEGIGVEMCQLVGPGRRRVVDMADVVVGILP